MLRDLRHSLRTLARSPSYTTAVILTLALGIGGTTAVFSVLRSVILRPFSWAPPDRVMMIAEQDSASNVRPASYPTFQDWRAGTNAFEALGANPDGHQPLRHTRSGATSDNHRPRSDPPVGIVARG